MFRIRFKTKDGSVVMDREGDKSIWVNRNTGRLDDVFADYSISRDASRKGVKILAYELNADKTAVEAIVDWL